MIKIIVEILILSPYFFIANKIGYKQATEFIEKSSFLKHYKLLVEYIYMMLLIGFLVFIILLSLNSPDNI